MIDTNDKGLSTVFILFDLSDITHIQWMNSE
jgi:hypothetical protein